MWVSISSRNEEGEGETQDPPSQPEGGAPGHPTVNRNLVKAAVRALETRDGQVVYQILFSLDRKGETFRLSRIFQLLGGRIVP